MRDMQAENGHFSDVAPVVNGFGGMLWGSAGIVVARETYQQYGDVVVEKPHIVCQQRSLKAKRENLPRATVRRLTILSTTKS